MGNGPTDGSSTPAGEPDDDFFSSWDKPAIKRPTPPSSRTATPPVVGRTPSPFLTADGTAPARSPSPLANSDAPAPASRAVHSSALRKSSSTSGAPRKANVLGGKKTSKLGAKKLGGGDVIDFDAAERKAKEEAERIEKLGYDPEAEDAAKKTAAKAESKVASPSPVSPGRGTYGNPTPRDRSGSDAEKLGMGMARLGFGQIGGGPKAAAPAKKMGGFGSVGPIKAKEEGMYPQFPTHSLTPRLC